MILQQTPTTPTEESLQSLVASAQYGDRQAFGELFTRYEQAVYAVAFRRLGNHAEAQELCQEVFIQALRKIDQLRDGRAFGGWVRAIANRMAINRAMRRGPVVSGGSDGFDGYYVENETPLGVALDREERAQVRQGLERLKSLDRDTLVAFYFDGRSLVEMSESFDSPVGTIKRRLHTARKRLAKELESLAPAGA